MREAQSSFESILQNLSIRIREYLITLNCEARQDSPKVATIKKFSIAVKVFRSLTTIAHD